MTIKVLSVEAFSCTEMKKMKHGLKVADTLMGLDILPRFIILSRPLQVLEESLFLLRIRLTSVLVTCLAPLDESCSQIKSRYNLPKS